MKIQACNPFLYPKMYSFKSSMNNTSTKILQDKLPNPRLYADYNNPHVDWDTKERLREEYCEKLFLACFDKDKKIDSRVVDFLDTTKFDIKTSNGSIKRMTVGEALKDSIEEIVPYSGSLYHATGSGEISQKILKEGFDPLKISRTKIGPGIYCTGSEGHAIFYSDAMVKFEYEGKCAYVQPEFYERIKNDEVLAPICNFVGMDTSTYPFGSDAYLVAGKMLDEYVRNYFVNELGVDMVEGRTGYCERSTAIFNFDKVSNLRIK
jgi:hypothetical protein